MPTDEINSEGTRESDKSQKIAGSAHLTGRRNSAVIVCDNGDELSARQTHTHTDAHICAV